MVMEGNSSLSGEHSMRYTDDVWLNCTLETYIIILSHVAPINFKKSNKTRITYGAFQQFIILIPTSEVSAIFKSPKRRFYGKWSTERALRNSGLSIESGRWDGTEMRVNPQQQRIPDFSDTRIETPSQIPTVGQKLIKTSSSQSSFAWQMSYE